MRARHEIRYAQGVKVKVIADDDPESKVQIGDVGTVIGHEDSETCVRVQFNGFTEWFWNDEVELV